MTPKPMNNVTTGTGTGGYGGERRSQEAQSDIPLAAEELLNDNENLKEQRWNTPFGATTNREGLGDKNVIRIATYNINGFPKMDRQGTLKFARIRQELQQIDCVGLSKLNRNWLKINAQQSLHNQLKPWWPRQKTVQTWLKDHEWPSEHQQEGTSLTLTSDKIYKYGQEKGTDMSGLGRWVWQTLEGHSETKSVIIQIYRPVRNTKDNGLTFMQQRVAADKQDPIRTFNTDLLTLMDGFLEDKFQVVIMGDFNIPLQGSSYLEEELKAQGITDAIQTNYRYRDAPNTQVRGSKPINTIFMSKTLEIIQGGYNKGRPDISGHCMIWADIAMDAFLGADQGDILRPQAKKLQISNRTLTMRFNKLFMQQMTNHRLLEKARSLERQIGETK